MRSISAAENATAEPNYELHEWGVFSIPANSAVAQQDMLVEWATFPEFFYRVWPMDRLPQVECILCWKPVIFIHGRPQRDIQVGIHFTHGRPLICWPAPAQTDDYRKICFRFDILPVLTQGELVPRPLRRPEVPKDHWIARLRQAGGSSLSVGGGAEEENFLYYDGVLITGHAAVAQRVGNEVVVTLQTERAVGDLFIVDREANRLRVARHWVKHIKGGTQTIAVPLRELAPPLCAKAVLTGLKDELAWRSAAQGLTPAEAQALADIWERGFLHRDGLTVFYRLPQETYDAWLPLRTSPQPRRSVRVGWVYHAHLEAELSVRLGPLIRQLDDEDSAVRDAAQKELLAVGGAAIEALCPCTEQTAQPELRERSKQLLKLLDTRPALWESKPRALQLEYIVRNESVAE